MAFSITKETPYGITAGYWRITAYIVNRIQRRLEVSLSGYPSKELSEAGAHPLISKSEDFELNSALLDGGRAAIYDHIRALMISDPDGPTAQFWSGATDV